MSLAPPVMMVWTTFWIFSSACSIGIAVSSVCWMVFPGTVQMDVVHACAAAAVRAVRFCLFAVAGRGSPVRWRTARPRTGRTGPAAFHLAARLGHEVGVALLDRVVQCDDGGLEFVVRSAYLPAQQTESLGGVAAREAGPSDRRVQRLASPASRSRRRACAWYQRQRARAHPSARAAVRRVLWFEPAWEFAEPQ